MDRGPIIITVLAALGGGLLWWLTRRGVIDLSTDRVRRGTGHALLGLQEFIEPSVEYVFHAENGEQKDENDHESGDADAIRRDLCASLGLAPIDPEEIRRHLAAAVRVGLDWREVYEEAVRVELRSRSFRAPSMPPAWRVQPRG